MSTTTTTRYWSNDNGMILCEAHAGYNLASAIEHRPKAREHHLPNGTWYLMTRAEAADFQTYIGGKPVCETCRSAR